MARKATKTEAVAEVKETVKAEEVKVEEVKAEEVKTEEVKEEAKPAASKKTTAKKETAKKTTVKKEVSTTVTVQFGGQEVAVNNVVENVKKAFGAEGHRVSTIKELQVYVKPEEYAAYYVINQKYTGKVDLF